MSEGQALLDGILAAPEDDALRLVYADWCEENGEAERAEFIRAEIELAKVPGGVPHYAPRRAQTNQLWKANAPRWYPGLLRLTNGMETQRGFPHLVAMPVRRFIQHSEALFRMAPTIVALLFGNLGKNAPALAASPALARLREVSFFETPFRAREAEQLFVSPHLGNLRSFDVGYTDTRMGPRGAIALARATSLTALEHLDLAGHAVYDEGASALLTADSLATLRKVNLSSNGLTDSTAFALSRAAHLGRLTCINLSDNYLTDHGVEALCRAVHLAGVEHLDLYDNQITQTGKAVLLERFGPEVCDF